jgi:hypothetical protein
MSNVGVEHNQIKKDIFQAALAAWFFVINKSSLKLPNYCNFK